MSSSSTFLIPTSPNPATGTFTTVFTSNSGGVVANLNGVGYGELLRSQTGESLNINGITIQPFESGTFTLDEQISQLLQPMKFTRKVAWGSARVYVMNPTVDDNQALGTLKYLTLGSRSSEFIFDGTTRFSYTLLPYATVNVQFNYTKITNFVMGNPKLVQQIIKLNESRNKTEEYLGGIAKEYVLSKKDIKAIVPKKK